MGRFINPFTDFGFKHIFGREMDKDVLIEFLNDLLEGEHVIKDLRILNNERLPETEQGRKVIFDIHCETDKGERIIIEMQNREQPNFKDRALYYLSHSVVEQGVKGTWDYKLAAVYGVFFLNFTLDEENETGGNRIASGKGEKFRKDIILADRETGQVFNPKFRQIYIELPRFNKKEEECETDFERWIYVLKHMETLERMPFKARKAIFERLERIGSMANLTPQQRAQYEAEWKMYNDYYNTIDFAVEKGRKKAMEEGMEKGMEKGKRSIALNLKKMGLSMEQISEATGLSFEEIKALE
ncbi:Rpn family recombination-promoting nuclease/putative transposase [Parabacteroides sp.]